MITLTAPASKSVSHRTLMGAALANGVSEVYGVLNSVDIARTMHILTAAGASFTQLAPGHYSVQGLAGVLRGTVSGAPLDCDVHESGTTCRLLTAVLAAGRGRFRLHGAARMHERPIGQLTKVLCDLGARITFEGRSQCPPFVLATEGLSGGTVHIGVDESSQYVSGLLLAAPLCRDGLTIGIAGQSVVSWPYVALTLQCLEDFGIHADAQIRIDATAPWQSLPWRALAGAHIAPGRVRFVVASGQYRAGQYTVEGDWSGASYLLAAGAVGSRTVCVQGLRPDSLQGDRALIDILRRMGAQITCTDNAIVVRPAALHAITVDMGDCPDLVPTVAVLAAFATGITTITGAAHLRIKESDRIAAPAAELRKAGIRVDEHKDGLSVHGAGISARNGLTWPHETVFCTHGDHRIAMSLALLGLHGHSPRMDAPGVVSKSFPDFWDVWERIQKS